ncbi:hypothetical protein FA95DRAFT_1566016 [Auriscalpium vulgare]|uniref:Uncharacterized protein n=1 Tax=Auriscalpium vulgare TaxID=40419 RepID=A0ACB8RBC3_9AGAM|nr:hypothetical protein FA95DRAFT_1566016 [Auriscalpium vulgare]
MAWLPRGARVGVAPPLLLATHRPTSASSLLCRPPAICLHLLRIRARRADAAEQRTHARPRRRTRTRTAPHNVPDYLRPVRTVLPTPPAYL